MSAFQQLIGWLDAHRDVAYDLLRIYLGVGLFARGMLFVAAPANSVDALMQGTPEAAFTSATLIHYVALAHLAGGLFMAIGLLTRLAALVQIPVLIGAVFLIHFEQGLLTVSQSLEFSALVLFLLVLVFVFGAGRWSVDYYLFRRDVPETVGRAPEVMEAARALNAKMKKAGPESCSCGHTRDHQHVTAEVHRGAYATLHQMLGLSVPPKEIIYRCGDCGEIVERKRDPELLRSHQNH